MGRIGARTLGLLLGLALGASPGLAQLPAPPVVGTKTLQIGGYGALTVTRPEHPEDVEKVEVSELVAAVLAWGRLSPRASYFVELDMAKRTTETWTGRESDDRVAPVRLYGEYAFDDLARLRAGRFLTPVGHWNERHAEPLTWSPTRPLSTYRPFAKSLTGLLLAGEGTVAGRDAGYAVFWAPSLGLDRHFEEDEETEFDHALGLRVATEVRPGWTLGLGAARIRRSQPPDSTFLQPEGDDEERENEDESRGLLAADLRWAGLWAEFDVEAVWLPASEHEGAESGVFGQAAVRLGGPVWAVGRVEHYSPVDGGGLDLGYAGLTIRPSARFVVKVGRQFVRRSTSRIPDGWFLSFSSLF